MFKNFIFIIILVLAIFIPLIFFVYAVVMTESAINAAEALGAYLGAIAAVTTAIYVVREEKRSKENDHAVELNSVYNILNMELLEFISAYLVLLRTVRKYIKKNKSIDYEHFLSLSHFSQPHIYIANAEKLGELHVIHNDFPMQLINFYMEAFRLHSAIKLIGADNNKNIKLKDSHPIFEMIEDLLNVGKPIVIDWSPNSNYGIASKNVVIQRLDGL